MAFYKENHQALVSYFQSGCHNAPLAKRLGVEVEHFVVRKNSLAPVYYKGDAEGGATHAGVYDLLRYLESTYPEKSYASDGELIGLSSPEASLSLEPAAQLEISIAPYDSLVKIQQVYEAFLARIEPFFQEQGWELVARGYHPSTKALDLPLIPKQRYQFMDEYFRLMKTHGERMMRASASTQVSIDFKDEADAIRKMRLAQALAPLLSFITDNVDVFEAVPTKRRLERFRLWRDVDNARCGSVPGLFSDGYGFGEYADWILETSPIFVTRPSAGNPHGESLRWVGTMPAKDAYGDAPMSETDVEHALSMFWPDVRLKRFVEIRPADSLPEAQALGYAALIKGLFYSEDAMSTLEDALGVVCGRWPFNDVSTNKTAATISAHGLEGTFAALSVAAWVELLFDTAKHALDEADQRHLEQLTSWFYAKQHE